MSRVNSVALPPKRGKAPLLTTFDYYLSHSILLASFISVFFYSFAIQSCSLLLRLIDELFTPLMAGDFILSGGMNERPKMPKQQEERKGAHIHTQHDSRPWIEKKGFRTTDKIQSNNNNKKTIFDYQLRCYSITSWLPNNNGAYSTTQQQQRMGM